MSEPKQSKDKGGKDAYPVLPLRDIVVFPYMIVPLFVGREKSINALEEVMRADKQILLAAQKNAATTIRHPTPSTRWARWLPCCSCEAAGRHRGAGGRHRAPGSCATWTIPTTSSRWSGLPSRPAPRTRGAGALGGLPVRATSSSTRRSRPRCSAPSARSRLFKLADTIASHLAIKIADKQRFRGHHDLGAAERVYTLMESEISVLQVEKKIRSASSGMEKTSASTT